MDGEETDVPAWDLPFFGGYLRLNEQSLYSLAKKYCRTETKYSRRNRQRSSAFAMSRDEK